ncbi:AAA family ATPase [Pseudonocardia sp. T1-2H]|uniref:AAA family ATPase n=1 Tax=Pseudonocardia sp. T1-2H TaxID=3128899 RepID=UPI0031013B44
MTLTLPGDTPSRPLPVPSTPPSRSAAPVRLRLPGRSLVLVAGMPGAGKSTMLRSVRPRPGLVVLDSDAQRDALVRLAPRTPYARLRPLVHLLHRLAVIAAALGGAPTVVVHLPATAPRLRRAAILLARLSRRDPHLVWFDVDPADALRGQRERGRVVDPGSFARHAERAEGVAERLRTGALAEPWRTVTVLDRPTAARGLTLDS